MQSPILITLLFVVTTLFTGCVGPGYPRLHPADTKEYAILEVDMRHASKLGDHEIMDISSIDGTSSDLFSNRRIARDSNGDLTKLYILLEPKCYTLTLRYTKALYRIAWWKFVYGDVTYDYDLKPGIYKVGARADDRFAYLSLLDSNDRVIGPSGKSVLKSETSSSDYFPIPLISK